MDLLSMVMNAVVEDISGDAIGQVEGIEIKGNRMVIIVDEVAVDDGDPDPGDEEDDDDEPLPFPRAVSKSGGGSSGG